jgi:prepilin-type N-terminal cleavage/methylation domain-containing protein
MRKAGGFSLIELLIVVAIILVIAAIAIPNLLRSRMAANESAAATTLRNLHNAQALYSTEFAALGFAGSLKVLGPGTPCDSTHACLIDSVIGCAAEPCFKSGYEYYLTSTATSAPFLDYVATGTPRAWQSTGGRNFCTATDGVIRQQLAPSDKVTAALDYPTCVTSGTFVALSQ